MLSDIEIARQATMLPITEIAQRLNIPVEAQIPYGTWKSKISLDYYKSLGDKPTGRLILVTAITPTPAGEGKTTTVIGLADALNRIGKPTSLCLREPSMGPCFGIKGGAAGGGYSQVVPMEDINLHFNGDLHAIGCAHNLLAAMLDNHIQQGNTLKIDPRTIQFGRVLDMNDRVLRHVIVGLGGTSHGTPRESCFDITVASEVMATFCLSESLHELRQRLGQIILGRDDQKNYVTARQINANGAMTVLLKDALQPNLVQTLEHTPAFIHGGPFANIAHGCSSVIATKLSMKLAEYTVTEAGFGADLGAEKFVDIKSRKAGLVPDVMVVVATVRALKFHGDVALKDLSTPNLEALSLGMANLKRHITNLRKFGRPIVVALNVFEADSYQEIQLVKQQCRELDVKVIESTHHSKGSEGAVELAEEVVRLAESAEPGMNYLYPNELPLWEKIRLLGRELYGAAEVISDKGTRDKLAFLQSSGYGDLPICMAKTPYSFSSDPLLKGAPTGFELNIRDVKLAAAAGFVIAYAGDIMTMPGLPAHPAAESIDIDEFGNVVGLF